MTPEQALAAALRSCPNHPYMVLPGPVEITGSFVASAMKWFADNGWALVAVPKDSTGRDLELLCRCKPAVIGFGVTR